MSNATLERTTFETSRELEFFTKKELMMQIGHDEDKWPTTLLKELIDNALDACEMAGTPPDIEVQVDADSFSVQDNGPGLPEATMLRSMDYLVRVSDKAYYVSPTRGQMGNALKGLWAASFVANGKGVVEVASCGKHHVVTVSLDRIAQKPRMNFDVGPNGVVRTGTLVRVHWPDSSGRLMGTGKEIYNAWLLRQAWTAPRLIETYAAFNPHATFRLNGTVYERTNPAWQKWRPNDPTTPHWYTPETLRDLIAAYVAEERRRNVKQKTVRAFVSEFRGLSSTIKQKEITAGYSGTYLQDMVKDDDIDPAFVAKLLADMRAACKPPRSAILGVIGKDHFTKWMIDHGNAAEKTIRYFREEGKNGGAPFIVEGAFALQKNDDATRILRMGMNWSPALGDPIPTLTKMVQEKRIDSGDPVTLVMHLAQPRFEFVDRGKTRVDW